MISKAWATMRTAKSFLPLLRPFIIKLIDHIDIGLDASLTLRQDAPVNQSLNNGHLCLLELLLGITTSGVGKVDSVTDLDVVGQRDVLDLDTVRREMHGQRFAVIINIR